MSLRPFRTHSDRDLLSLVVGRRTRRRAIAQLLDWAGDLSSLAHLSEQALEERLGTDGARRVAAVCELTRRIAEGEGRAERWLFDEPEQVIRWARPRMALLNHEEVWLLSLDASHHLRVARRVAQGGSHACALSARDILSPALRDGASAIVLVHNHPSGCPEPSLEDVAMTRAVASACAMVGLSLLDHVVVARRGATSLAALGALDLDEPRSASAFRAPPSWPAEKLDQSAI